MSASWCPMMLSSKVAQDPLEVDEDVSDSSYFSDNDDNHLDLNTDLIGVRRTTKDLNIVDAYRPRWTCKEAFRESYQNWRDGILRSFDLDQSQFRPIYTEKKRTILIEARHPDTKELLGFIHFKADKDGYCVGGLKIANFKATLKYCDLGTGATTKAHDDGQTGQHGDGMKLSALVYRRNNYNVRFESGNFKWRFLYKKGSLACSLTRINEKSLDKMKQKAKGQARTHDSHPWEDVCLVVAAPGPARDIFGYSKPGKRLSMAEFKEWITVTIDINPPKYIIRTIHGDLIRDHEYQGRMYLRGLLLPRGGKNGKEYTYGYNFVEGSTSSDRDALSGIGEESEGISAIWSAAIRADESSDSELVSEYTNLLLSSINEKGDVMMPTYQGGDELMPGDIARRVWAKMLTLNKDNEGRTAFYYLAGDGKNEVHIIEKDLRKNPVPIDPVLWRILRKYFLCKTPRDELLHRFKSAKVVQVPDKSFARHMSRMLECLLMSSSSTKDMKLTFVNGEHLDIDAGFATNWRIHNKWLAWEGAHEQTFCEEDQSSEVGPFSCDHAVLQLWDIMISQLMATGDHPEVVTEERWLKSMARSRLSQMPRSVKCSPTLKKGELLVTWESTDSHIHKHKTVKVILHRFGCVRLEEDYLHCNEGSCSCPCLVSQAVSDGVTFSDLDINTHYRPSVFRSVDGAFIAVLPNYVKPLDEDAVDLQTPEVDAEPVLPSVETGVHLATSDLNTRRSNHRPARADSDDDEMEENGSLYQAPSISPPPSIPMAPPAWPATLFPKSRPVRSKAMPLNFTKQEDFFILGTKVEHKALDWGGGFPGSHDFYRTLDRPNQDIYILKPKVRENKSRHKRVNSGAKDRGNSKKSRTSTAAEQVAHPAYIVLSSPEPEDDQDTRDSHENLYSRNGLETTTPLPERGITYRY